MSENVDDLLARIQSLEEEIETLKYALGHFSVGLDKVSRVQADQTVVIEGLLRANEAQVQYLKQLVDSSKENNRLLKRLTNNKKRVSE